MEPIRKALTGYGKTFNDEKTMNAYAKYQSEKRAKAKARLTDDDKEKSAIRKHFAKESKRFGVK